MKDDAPPGEATVSEKLDHGEGAPSLSDRIADALGTKPGSADVAALIAETSSELDRLRDELTVQRGISLDPRASTDVVASSRRVLRA